VVCAVVENRPAASSIFTTKEDFPMKYACLVYIDPALDNLSQEEGQALTDASIDHDTDLRERGHLIYAQALQGPETAVTVRIRDGKMSATDGPFAETKEFLAGFMLIEAKDLNEAIQLAGKAPMARFTIEVRPLLDLTHS
jgi:hypothetical protein